MTSAPLAIVIGGSAGSLQALSVILSALPENFRVPIAVVVHLPTRGRSQLCEVLRARCQLLIAEVDDKSPLAAAGVHVCPANYHLLIEQDLHLSLTVDDAVNFSRPSIDVLFESAALACGERLIGVLLSGANADGAQGLCAIQLAGGVVIVQSPRSAVARTMPEAALSCCSPDAVLSPIDIGDFLAKF